MSGRDIILLVGTFLLGLFVGFYVYVIGFAPNYEFDNVPRADDVNLASSQEFEIIGEMYGDCAHLGCGAYRLQNDRSYVYTEISTSGSDQPEFKRDSLSSWRFNNLTALLTSERLAAAAKPISFEGCSSFDDGVQFRFSIKLAGSSYHLDTCRTDLLADENLNEVLTDVFDWVR